MVFPLPVNGGDNGKGINGVIDTESLLLSILAKMGCLDYIRYPKSTMPTERNGASTHLRLQRSP
jgi:hypothetical protein